MPRHRFQVIGLCLLAGLSCRADVTLRYTVEVKIGGAAPPAVVEAMKQQLAAILPQQKVVRVKDDRSLSTVGAINGIVDNAKAEITLLNPATKKYARIPMADYPAAIRSATPVSPAAQQALEHVKFDVHNSSTGQMAMVFGIRAEEQLTTMSISTDLPNRSLPGAAAAAEPLMRLEIHTWLSSPGDLDRIPGLRQYAENAQRARAVFNPADQIQELFSQMPGIAETMRALTAPSAKNAGSLTVKMQEKLYMPMMGQLMREPAKSDPPATDPDAALMEIEENLAGISNDAIDDSVFEVPTDYQMAPVSELLEALKPPAPGAPKSLQASAAARLVLDSGEKIMRVGGGVSPPSLLSRRDPEYTEEARRAKLSGIVVLSVVIDKEGVPRNIQVVRPLGGGLDEKAMAAVSQWRFKPGQQAGQPVNVRAQIEVNFKLLDRPPLKP